MDYPAIITFVLFGILRIQWSTATVSTGICIDRLSSFIVSICNDCIQIALPSLKYIGNFLQKIKSY